MYIRLLVACAAMLLSLLCFDGIGADDHNYFAAEEEVSFISLPAETQDAVIEAVGEGVMFTPMPLSFVGGRIAEDADNARADGAKNYENCALDDGEILFCDRFVKEEGAMARMIAEQKALEERRRIEAERRRIEAERAAEQRRIAEEKHRAAEKEAALRAACPGYDDAFVATLTPEEQAEARWFYERGYVFYRQNWSSVKDAPYGDCGFGQCGCGPTCVAAIVSNLAGVPVDPEEMRVYGLSVGSWLPSGGTTYGFLISTAQKYGISATQIYAGDKNALFEALKDENKLVLATMGPGDFTLGAHFMLFRGITDEGKILIADSYSFEHSVREWDYDELYAQLKTGYWIFEKSE